MKKHFVFLFVCGAIVLNSCSKNEDENPSRNPEFKLDHSRFSLSVENNTIIFENLESLYKCTDYLNEIGEENFDLFEKEIGFYSYRTYSKMSNDSTKYPNELIGTLMNPENEIIVKDRLIAISSNLDSVSIFKFEQGFYNCEYSQSSLEKKVSVSDNVYDLFREEGDLKGACNYCGGYSEKAPIYEFNSGITVKIGNYDWVFGNVLEATISKDGWGGTVSIGLGTNLNSTSFYRDCKGCSTFSLNYKEGFGSSYTISRSTSPLTAYYFSVVFSVYEHAAPTRGEEYIGAISCKPYLVCSL